MPHGKLSIFNYQLKTMSRIKKQLELAPPMWMQPDAMTETFTSTGYTCPRCQGNGWHWAVRHEDGMLVKAPCTMCGGAGRLDAAISVQWKASPSNLPRRGGSRIVSDGLSNS